MRYYSLESPYVKYVAKAASESSEGLQVLSFLRFRLPPRMPPRVQDKKNNINWLKQADSKNLRLSSAPKNLDNRLNNDIWSKGLPMILTSGTLSASGDFTRAKQSLGLERIVPYRMMAWTPHLITRVMRCTISALRFHFRISGIGGTYPRSRTKLGDWLRHLTDTLQFFLLPTRS